MHADRSRGDLVRQVINLMNLSTVAGLFVAGVGGATLSRGPHGLVLATGYRLRFPKASAFTIGDVVLSVHSREQLLARPRLIRHEARHSVQYAWCLGVAMLPLYALGAMWSLVRVGDPATSNPFEQLAGLDDGGYRRLGRRRGRRRRARAQVTRPGRAPR
jgi:hypothetical protein